MLDGSFDFGSFGTLFALAFFLVLTTLGVVLLVHLIAPRMRWARKTLLGAMLGPNATIVPFALFATITGDSIAAALAMVLAMAIFSLVIGWPVAHFANKRLHSLSSFDAEIFE